MSPLARTDVFPLDPPKARPRVILVDITVKDQSPTWDWQWAVACRPALELYLAQRYSLRSLEVALVDDPTIGLGVAYPKPGASEAVGLADCTGDDYVLSCRVAVGHGEPRDALDTAVTIGIVYAI